MVYISNQSRTLIQGTCINKNSNWVILRFLNAGASRSVISHNVGNDGYDAMLIKLSTQVICAIVTLGEKLDFDSPLLKKLSIVKKRMK